jgi:hypothetical protein
MKDKRIKYCIRRSVLPLTGLCYEAFTAAKDGIHPEQIKRWKESTYGTHRLYTYKTKAALKHAVARINKTGHYFEINSLDGNL